MGEGPGREPGADDPGPLLPTPVAVRQSRRAQWLAGGRVPALGGTTGTPGTGRADRGARAGDRAIRAAADAWTVRRLQRERACGDWHLPCTLSTQPLLGSPNAANTVRAHIGSATC